jgi:hypothetical protein
VYGKVSNFQSVRFPNKLFVLAHDLELHSLADESANFIGRIEFHPSVVFSWYDLFVRKGSTVGLTLLSKSKVSVQESKHIFTVVCIIYLFQCGLCNFHQPKGIPMRRVGFGLNASKLPIKAPRLICFKILPHMEGSSL